MATHNQTNGKQRNSTTTTTHTSPTSSASWSRDTRRPQQPQSASNMPERRAMYSDLARPMDVFDAFAREMDSLFESFGIGRMGRQPGYRGGMSGSPSNSGPMAAWRDTDDFKMNTWNPTMEAFYEGDTFVVCADLPGMKKEQVDCRITSDNVLILTGERQSSSTTTPKTSKDGSLSATTRRSYVTERSYGTFRRTMTLPDNLDTEKVSAKFEDGVLRLEFEVDRSAEEDDTSRKIEIQ